MEPSTIASRLVLPRPFVGGHRVGDRHLDPGNTFSDIDPSTGEILAEIPIPRIECSELAMEAAADAQAAWARLSMNERRQPLLRLATMLERKRSRLEDTIRAETGILHKRAMEEVGHAIELLRETAALREPAVETVEQEGIAPGTVEHMPYGVVVWIMSWNSPLAALCKIAAPLLLGNTVVLKASHHAPLCASAFAEAVEEADFPAGTVNVLWDSQGELVRHLVTDARLGKCAFTGRASTARSILQHISDGQLRPTFMETGGGGVQVVRSDADLESALPHLFWGVFTLAGQICCAGGKILVHRSMLNRLAEEISGRLLSMRIGSAHDDRTQMGPLIAKSEVIRMGELLHRARVTGTVLVPLDLELPGNGFFVSPQVTISTDCSGPCFMEEIFGPVAALAPFSDDDDLLRKIEGLKTGLTLSLYTSDSDWLIRNRARLRFGTIWCNGHYQSSARLPFGGAKDSGYGRERGAAGLREFSQCQVIVNPECERA